MKLLYKNLGKEQLAAGRPGWRQADNGSYSDLNELIGFIIDAFIVWKLTVSNVMINAPAVVTTNTHIDISVWYSYFCSHPDK